MVVEIRTNTSVRHYCGGLPETLVRVVVAGRPVLPGRADEFAEDPHQQEGHDHQETNLVVGVLKPVGEPGHLGQF